MPLLETFTESEPRTTVRPKLAVPALSSLIDGRYHVLGRLAQGGMGIIYRAEDVLLQRPAALKVIDPELARSEASIESFRREARSLARVRHENVVQIYAFGMHGESCYFAMELVDGTNLEDILLDHAERGTTMPLDLALETIGKIASGLSAAHARGITHRDVKPANIVVERETSRPVLVDFGIARHSHDTQHEHASGTPMYMAPEQIRNEIGHDGARADLYSLACGAFEILSGRPPFASDHTYQLMVSHMELPPPLLSSVRPEYQALDAVFARALAKTPRYRYESCVAFADALREAAKTIPRDVRPPVRPREAGVLILAEEDGVRRSLVREANRALGAAVHCVTEAAALCEAVERSRPAVILIDDDAAGGASLDLVRRIRSLERGDAIHIVVLTRDMLAERSVWQSVNAKRLSKPFSPRALASTLEDLG